MGSVNTTAILKVFQFDSDFFISNDRYMDDYEGSFGDKLVCNINNYLYAWTDPTWFKDGEKMKRMEYPGTYHECLLYKIETENVLGRRADVSRQQWI